MDNISTSELGTLVYTATSAGGSSTTTTLQQSGSLNVSSGAIIKGDHHSPNSWSYSVTKTRSLTGSLRQSQNGLTRVWTGVLSSGSTGVTSSNINAAIGKAYDQALSSCLDGLYGRLRGSTDLTTSVAEAYKDRLGSKSAALARVADDARRDAEWRMVSDARGTKVPRATRRLDDGLTSRSISRSWLALQYKWRPIVDDIFNVAREATGTMTRKGFTVTASGTGSCGFDPVSITLQGFPFSKIQPKGSATVTCKGSFRFVINSTADAAARLASYDPAVIAWNLVPYSFVVDWVYNVGGYLRNLETRAMYNNFSKGGYVSTRIRANAGLSYGGLSSQYNGSLTCSSSYEHKRMFRTVYSGLPSPGKPRINLDIGGRVLINAAALLHVKLKAKQT